jgi:hypothetical protein
MYKEVTIFIIILVVIIFIYFVYKYINGTEKLKNIKKNENFKIENSKKVIQYFGGDYCPFSNTDSNAYKVVKDFENFYGDKVVCKYYWVGQDDDVMKQLNVMYVPTILNGNNEKIELKLSDDIDKSKLSNEELKVLLLENIYNKL